LATFHTFCQLSAHSITIWNIVKARTGSFRSSFSRVRAFPLFRTAGTTYAGPGLGFRRVGGVIFGNFPHILLHILSTFGTFCTRDSAHPPFFARPAPPTKDSDQALGNLNTPQKRVGGAIFGNFSYILSAFRAFYHNLEHCQSQNGVLQAQLLESPRIPLFPHGRHHLRGTRSRL